MWLFNPRAILSLISAFSSAAFLYEQVGKEQFRRETEKSHGETPLCGWVGEYFVGLGLFVPERLRGAGWESRWVSGRESRPLSEGLRRAAPGAQGGAREPRPCPGSAGLSPGPERPHGRLAHGPRESTRLAAAFPGIRGRPVRAVHSKFSRAGRRACSRFLEAAAAASRPLPALPSRPLPPLPAARPEFPSPAPAGPSSGHCPRSLRPGHTRPPAEERPAPLGFVPNSASALLPLPPAPRQSPPSPVPAPALAGSPSLPRPPSFHTNSHSSHSSLPPFKLQGK